MIKDAPVFSENRGIQTVEKAQQCWAFSIIYGIIIMGEEKMLERGKMERGIYEIVDTESLVSAEHLLRKIDAAVDWNKLYDMVEPLYCADNGRPSVDPVVLCARKPLNGSLRMPKKSMA